MGPQVPSTHPYFPSPQMNLSPRSPLHHYHICRLQSPLPGIHQGLDLKELRGQLGNSASIFLILSPTRLAPLLISCQSLGPFTTHLFLSHEFHQFHRFLFPDLGPRILFCQPESLSLLGLGFRNLSDIYPTQGLKHNRC